MSRWYQGRRRSEAGIEACRARSRAKNRRRVGTHAEDYVGMAPTAEQAAALNDEVRAFRAAQRGRP